MTTDAKTADGKKTEDAPLTIKERVISEIKFFAGLFVFIIFFFTTVWGHYKIPSESMLPTLEVGDHVYVSKFTYGYSRHSLPFGLHKLPIADGKQIFSRLPKRGDVVVFRNPRSKIIMIKRVVGLPGDTVETRAGRLYLNGTQVGRTNPGKVLYRAHKNPERLSFFGGIIRAISNIGNKDPLAIGPVTAVTQYEENIAGEKNAHMIYENSDQGRADNSGPFTIPSGHVFFMGDNRDNSVDSRDPAGPGMVPVDHLIGRADSMMFSRKKCTLEEGLYCPPRRFFKGL